MDRMTDFLELPDLAAARLGGRALWANDEFFAERENLLKEAPAIYLADRYTDRGKWMDGWESRRRRTPGHDRCVIRLGIPGVVRGVVVDTAFFKGNFPESFSLEGCAGEPPETSFDREGAPWATLIPQTALEGDRANLHGVGTTLVSTHLRLNIFPDGGVARLRVHGEPLPDWPALPASFDLGALANGAFVTAVSDRFFGPPHKIGLPGPALGMHDGWETRRRRGPGHDWVVVRLAAAGVLEGVEVDTSHFKGNAPGSCSLEGCAVPGGGEPATDTAWIEILPRTALQPHAIQVFDRELRATGPYTHVRLNTYPDGGIARLRLYGRPTREGRAAATLRWLNLLPSNDAATALLSCCGATAWAQAIAAARPFSDLEALQAAAARAADTLGAADWDQAFSSHPRLGGLGGDPAGAGTDRWARDEQSGSSGADDTLSWNLAAANHRYEARFGRVFLLCATGKTGEEMLEASQARLHNDPESEQRIAAGEQRKITKLRLEKLLWGT